MTADTRRLSQRARPRPCIASGHIPAAPFPFLRRYPLGGQDCRGPVNLCREWVAQSCRDRRSAHQPQLKHLCS